jgi:hypothetical protein
MLVPSSSAASLPNLLILFAQVKPSESCAHIAQRGGTTDSEDEESGDEEEGVRSCSHSRSVISTALVSSPDATPSISSVRLGRADSGISEFAPRVRARPHSPTATEMIQSARPLITYSRVHRERAQATRIQAAALVDKRRSKRLLRAENDNAHAMALIAEGKTLVAWVNRSVNPLNSSSFFAYRVAISMPRPLVDRHDYVIAAVAGGPKGQPGWWSQITERVLRDIKRMQRNGLFSSSDASESRIRFGIGFGEEYAVSG